MSAQISNAQECQYLPQTSQCFVKAITVLYMQCGPRELLRFQYQHGVPAVAVAAVATQPAAIVYRDFF